MAILRSACLLLCLISCLEPALTAQAPPEVKPPQLVKSAALGDCSKEPYIFDLIQARCDADGKTQCDLTIRVRIQSQSGLGLLIYSLASGLETLDVAGQTRTGQQKRLRRTHKNSIQR